MNMQIIFSNWITENEEEIKIDYVCYSEEP